MEGDRRRRAAVERLCLQATPTGCGRTSSTSRLCPGLVTIAKLASKVDGAFRESAEYGRPRCRPHVIHVIDIRDKYLPRRRPIDTAFLFLFVPSIDLRGPVTSTSPRWYGRTGSRDRLAVSALVRHPSGE